jgi:hypothetical protein
MSMDGIRKIVASTVFLGLTLGLALLPQSASSGSTRGLNMEQSAGDEPVPAYHEQVPRGVLPATMSPELFSDPLVQNAYTVAARIKKTLYQEPCYCHCDRSQGHASLLDCFASKHGSECNICMFEDFYTYEQSRKGKSAAQIRTGIIKGEWQTVDASKYQQPLPAK